LLQVVLLTFNYFFVVRWNVVVDDYPQVRF